MTRREWTEIAIALARVRSDVPRSQIDCVDRAARAVCRAIRARSSRFDGRHFMRLVGTNNK